MFTARFLAFTLAFAVVAPAYAAAETGLTERQLEDLYYRGRLEGRPLFTNYYERNPHEYFRGWPVERNVSIQPGTCERLEDNAYSIVPAPASLEYVRIICKERNRSSSSRRVPLYLPFRVQAMPGEPRSADTAARWFNDYSALRTYAEATSVRQRGPSVSETLILPPAYNPWSQRESKKW